MKFKGIKKMGSRWWASLLVASAFNGIAKDSSDWFYSWLDTPAREEGWARHFRLGYLAGVNLKANFSASGGGFGISGSQPGAIASGVNHVYDDGYVRVDDTGNAGGFTSYWGYNNAGQDIAGRLVFHSANSFSAAGSSGANDDLQNGLDLAYGGALWQVGRATVGWEVGFGWLMLDMEDKSSMNVTATRTVHSYDYGSIILPDAPYNGGSSGVGPVINDLPALETSDSIGGTLSGTRSLDASLFTLRLGPTVSWELPANFAVQLSGGAALGFVTGDLKYNERIAFTDGSSAINAGSVSGDEIVYGGYVGATLMFHTVEHGDFYIGAQYMPLGNVTFSGGGRQADLEMSGGLYLSAGINWPF